MVLTATPVTPTKTKTSNRLTKAALIDQVAERLGITKVHAKKLVQAMLDVVTEALAADKKVNITGFGSFETRQYKARQGVNPQTGARITIPSTKRAVFTPGASLKRAVKGE